jgi:EF-P beta-lysylation protein EpmB
MSSSSNGRKKARIIARSPDAGQVAWQGALLDSTRDADSLFGRLALDPALLPGARAAAARFECRVTPEMLGAAGRGAEDPVLRQFLPAAAELEEVPGFVADPVGDLAAARSPGLLQKYAGRALLVTTAACAVHCRYCFRRHFPYVGQTAARDAWQGALAQLAASPDVAEVILSGGDPLMLSDERLAALWDGLAAIPQVVRLRVHTRMPTAVPERVTPALLALLRRPRFASSVVVHVNHAAELAPGPVAALRALRGTGVALLNQSVLLRGVNDDADALCALSERLFAAGALPYYLHLLDPVAGAAHFAVDEAVGRRLLAQMRARLPGYLVPRLVRESPGQTGKTPVAC